MEPIRFAILGGGWRAEFYLRIARALPERFRVTSVLVRDEAKGQRFENAWRVPTCRTLDCLVGTDMQFVVTSVPWAVNPVVLKELAERGVPALSETPPAPDVDGLIALQPLVKAGARIQVAEQYSFQPHHAARLAIARSGKLGEITQAQVSAAHGYHGVSLMRRFLGIGCENAVITARSFKSPIVAGPGRDGGPSEEKVGQSGQTIAWFDFGGKLGVFDFAGDQYFSWIRSQRLLVRGERGEINNREVRYLEDFRTPISYELRRENAGEDGNLEGDYLKGILGGSEWVYRNPFAPGRLTDDEIAIAACLQQMAEYAEGGPEFYSLAEASQDHYLSLMMDRAVAAGEPIHTHTQPWAEA